MGLHRAVDRDGGKGTIDCASFDFCVEEFE